MFLDGYRRQVNTSWLAPVTASAARVRVAAQRQAVAYGASERERPLSGYLHTMSVYAGATGTLALVARARGVRLPESVPVADIALLSVATYRLSRLISKDAITSPLRARWTRFVEPAGPGEVVEEVRGSGSGAAHATGELLTCPFCLAQWVATGLVFAYLADPRLTRWVAATLTAVTGSNLLQFVHARVQPA